MVTAVHEVQRGPLPERLQDGAQEPEIGELVASPLQEEHWNRYMAQVLAARERRTAGWMQREAEEREPANAGQRLLGLRGGGHAAPERFPTRDERHSRCGLGGQLDGGPYSRRRHR